MPLRIIFKSSKKRGSFFGKFSKMVDFGVMFWGFLGVFGAKKRKNGGAFWKKEGIWRFLSLGFSRRIGRNRDFSGFLGGKKLEKSGQKTM